MDEHGAPISTDQLEVGSWLTAFAEGSDRRALGSSVAVVQIEQGEVRVRRDWAPLGIMAYEGQVWFFRILALVGPFLSSSSSPCVAAVS